MKRAKGPNTSLKAFTEVFLEIFRVERFAADLTFYEFKGGYFFPLGLEEALEFNGLLGADSPTIAATRTSGDIMKQDSCLSIIFVTQGVCRAIVHAGQTPVASLVYFKK